MRGTVVSCQYMLSDVAVQRQSVVAKAAMPRIYAVYMADRISNQRSAQETISAQRSADGMHRDVQDGGDRQGAGEGKNKRPTNTVARVTLHLPGRVRHTHYVAEYVSGDGWQNGSRTQEEERHKLPKYRCVRKLEDYGAKRGMPEREG